MGINREIDGLTRSSTGQCSDHRLESTTFLAQLPEGTWETTGTPRAESTVGPDDGASGGSVVDGEECRSVERRRVSDKRSAEPSSESGGSAFPEAPHSSGGKPQNESGILSAGSFDDGINLEVFQKYWESKVGAVQGMPLFEALKPLPRFGAALPPAIDISLVIDVTGSMGDELEYLKREISSIVSEIKKSYPQVVQRHSLIVYRDQGDQYVTRGIDLSADFAKFQNYLGAQSAGGGGDYPEAMQTALREADEKLQWGDASVGKILFLIADAPPHDQDMSEAARAVAALKNKGVHIYPVAASGVGDVAERFMRFSAITTGGEYIFLTDDSGVGESHQAPHFPCYSVTKLKDIILNSIRAELSQKRIEPEPGSVIRTVGKALSGVCQESVKTQSH